MVGTRVGTVPDDIVNVYKKLNVALLMDEIQGCLDTSAGAKLNFKEVRVKEAQLEIPGEGQAVDAGCLLEVVVRL